MAYYLAMEAALKAIAEPRRRDILRVVSGGERTVSQIASHFDVTRPAISQHLRVLKEAGLVTERRDGTRRWYRVRTDGFTKVRAFLEPFWDAHLEAIKDGAERRGGRRGRDRT